jgi:SpoVK/Ycf46/Vps4 family AAA+-type ATPase
MAEKLLKCSIAEPPSEFAEQERIFARNLVAANRFTLLRSPRDPEPPDPPRWLDAQSRLLVSDLPGAPDTWEGRLDAIRREAGGRTSRAGISSGRIGRNVRALGRLLRLTHAEQVVLQFKLMLLLLPGFWEMLAWYGQMPTDGAASIIAAMTGEPERAIGRALDSASAIVSTGMLSIDSGREFVGEKLLIPSYLTDLLTGPRLTRTRFADRWMPLSPPPGLVPSDYGHMGEAVPRLVRILAAALDRGEAGVNILLHGPTGTGKTELARLLAKEIGSDLRMAGTKKRDGGDDGAGTRLGSVVVGQLLLGNTRCVILFDEMEDLFEKGNGPAQSKHRLSKGYLTSLLETNAVPVIWTTNDVASMDPALVRRFVATVEVPGLNEAQRRVVWLRHTGGQLPGAEVDRLARRFRVSPGTIAGVVRGARLAGGGRIEVADVEALVASSAEALGIRAVPAAPAAMGYDPSVLCASVDLEGLADRLLAAGERASVTICLHGPPGTGKSEWVRQLAERMRRPIHAHRVSDIESMWVGQAEKNVSRAFDLAEREGAILLFDEADSFLQDRRTAARRWEQTITNEFLQHLEAARGIVACTTNTFDALDPAVMRRFSVKVGFRYLDVEAATSLFSRAFGSSLGRLDDADRGRVRAKLALMPPLAPGDFAAVARRLPLLPPRPAAGDILRELEAEAAARIGSRAGTLGFKGPRDR